jgi:hypothetical protein
MIGIVLKEGIDVKADGISYLMSYWRKAREAVIPGMLYFYGCESVVRLSDIAFVASCRVFKIVLDGNINFLIVTGLEKMRGRIQFGRVPFIRGRNWMNMISLCWGVSGWMAEEDMEEEGMIKGGMDMVEEVMGDEVVFAISYHIQTGLLSVGSWRYDCLDMYCKHDNEILVSG